MPVHAVHLVSRPHGPARADDFAFVEEPMPRLRPGTALVENLYQSVDPYMREAMDGTWPLHGPLEGRALGRVLASDLPGTDPGDLVFHRRAWRTHALVEAGNHRVIRPVEGVPVRTYLSLLGGTGLTAWVGLTRVARLQPGEDLFVSAAAGGVGSAVGQLARLLGAGRIVGSAGSDAKVRLLTEELGFDAAFDHHTGPLSELLGKAAPDGLNVYFDNVGSTHLEAAIDHLRPFGRVAWCGAVAQYETPEPPAAPRNLYAVVGKSLRVEGFLVRNHLDAQGELEEFLVPHLRTGAVRPLETVTEGFDRLVDAFLDLLRGGNTGKAIVSF